MPPLPTIRLATLADLPLLHQLWNGLCIEQDAWRTAEDTLSWTQDTATRLERQATGDPDVYCRLAEDAVSGSPLGFLAGWVEVRRIGHPHRYWMADHLYVVPAARGRGVGAALIRDGMTHAAKCGMDTLECVALATDPQWAARGWTPTLTRYRATLDAMQAHYEARGLPRLPLGSSKE